MPSTVPTSPSQQEDNSSLTFVRPFFVSFKKKGDFNLVALFFYLILTVYSSILKSCKERMCPSFGFVITILTFLTGFSGIKTAVFSLNSLLPV